MNQLSILKRDVAVIIPAYNRPDELLRAIKSCLQENVAVEVMVVDNSNEVPVDSALLAEFGPGESINDDEQVFQAGPHLIRHRPNDNPGSYRSRLMATKWVASDYLKFLDHDDFLLGDTLHQELAAGKKDNADIVLSNWQVRHFDATGNELTAKRAHHIAPTYQNPVDDLLTVGGVFTSAALYATRCFDEVEPVSDWTPVKADDWLIFAQAVLAGDWVYTRCDQEVYAWVNYANEESPQQSVINQARMAEEAGLILSFIENSLRQCDRLTEQRKNLLATYYLKNALFQYRSDRQGWAVLCERVDRLVSRPVLPDQFRSSLKFLCKALGYKKGIAVYSALTEQLRR